tara:strand:- start:303 stop:476 length:174 start_codon:yes stop_codon:yes gene_type:complete
MDSLKVMVMLLEKEISVVLEGEVEEIVGAVVSEGVGAGEMYSFSGVDSEPPEHPVCN